LRVKIFGWFWSSVLFYLREKFAYIRASSLKTFSGGANWIGNGHSIAISTLLTKTQVKKIKEKEKRNLIDIFT
jgi:hypothetical protein